MSTQRERAEQKRQLKLEAVAQQIKDGSLTIRQMTAAERQKYVRSQAPAAKRRHA